MIVVLGLVVLVLVAAALGFGGAMLMRVLRAELAAARRAPPAGRA